jgi:hypothetical protein
MPSKKTQLIKKIPLKLLADGTIQFVTFEDRGCYLTVITAMAMNPSGSIAISSLEAFWPTGRKKLLTLPTLFREENDEIVCIPFRILIDARPKITKIRKKAGHASALSRWGEDKER